MRLVVVMVVDKLRALTLGGVLFALIVCHTPHMCDNVTRAARPTSIIYKNCSCSYLLYFTSLISISCYTKERN